MKRLSFLAGVGCLLGSIGLLGCSGTLIPSRGADREDLSELKKRVLELQEAAAVTQVELDRVRRELALLSEGRRTPGQFEESARSTADSSAPKFLNPSDNATIVAHSAAPQGTLESSDLAPHTVEPLITDSEDAEYPESEAPAGGLSQQAAIAPGILAVGGNHSAVSDQAQELYDRGYTLYHQTRYVDAESGFRRFLQSYPRNDLSDNAQYWIGECRYARGDIRGALAAFQETVERYPDGNKVPDAILKLAGCLEELGAEEAAQARYDEVMRRFPNTAAATSAEERRPSSE